MPGYKKLGKTLIYNLIVIFRMTYLPILEWDDNPIHTSIRISMLLLHDAWT
jgi:hypothetical protein